MTEQFAAAEPLWLARRAQDLAWAELGDDFVVYHRPSGKTHYLNIPTAALLTDVLLHPKTAAAAAAELAALEQAPGDAAFVAAVEQSLHDLELLGLVERL